MVDLEMLNRLYFEDMLSLRIVADKMETTHSALRACMKKNGIKARTRAEAISLAVSTGRRSLSKENNPNYKAGLNDKLRDVSGIYFLYDGLEIVYMGKATKSMYSRVNSHIKLEKLFDRVVGYEINNDSDIHVIELYLVNKYRPKYNIDSLGEDLLTLKIDNWLDCVSDEIEIELDNMSNKARWEG